MSSMLEQELEGDPIESLGHERRYAVRTALEDGEARSGNQLHHFARIFRARYIVRRTNRDERRHADAWEELGGIVRHRRPNLGACTRPLLSRHGVPALGAAFDFRLDHVAVRVD